ncbi:MAG TPA: long-chain fatty acid--CoA ligase [Polyangia bacterium]|nr:long-chain fatty acid--CoA ligase [Polyangia bacterium]
MSSDSDREAATAIELWSRRVADSRDRCAFKYKQGGAWKELSWLEADTAAREIASGLAENGVKAGDRVCLLSQTRVEWMLCDLAVLYLGAITVPIYASNTADQCAFILRNCGARVAIVEDASQLEKLLSIRGELSAVSRFIHIAGDATLERPDSKGRTEVRLHDVRAPGDDSIRSLDEIRAAGAGAKLLSAEALAQRSGAVGPDSTFTIIYTSGTTGTPKGVVLSHRNLTSVVASACRAMTLFANDEQLLFLPMAHVLGRQLAWVAVQAGLDTCFAESIAKLKDNLAETRPTYMAGVPRVFEKFYAGVQRALGEAKGVKGALVRWSLGVARLVTEAFLAGKQLGGMLALKRWLADRLVFGKLRGRLGLDRCRFLVSGAAPLTAEIGEFFYGIGVPILEGYGLTETTAPAFLNRFGKMRFGTVGEAFDIVEAKIADDGEILMRGPSIFSRYHENAEATAEAIDAEGWFHSGDIGTLEGGFLRITDRKKDLIVTAGGKKVAPQPIENAIKARTTLVGQAVVFGDMRPYCVALLTPSEDALKLFGGTDGVLKDEAGLRAELDKVLAAINATLAPYETIKTFALLKTDFTEASGELTPSLKVKRKVVIEKYRAAIEDLYKNARVAAE